MSSNTTAGFEVELLPGLAAVQTAFRQNVLAIIGVVGTVSNLASAIVFARNLRRFSPSCVYFLVLSVADLFCSLLLCLLMWLSVAGPRVDLFKLHQWGCKLMRYVQLVAMSSSAYVMALLSCERAASLLLPLRSISWFTKGRRLKAIACVLCASACVWLQALAAFEIRPLFAGSSQSGCYPSLELPVQFSVAFNFQMSLVNYTLPMLLIAIANLLAAVKFHRNSEQQQQQQQRAADAHAAADEVDVKVTMVLLSLQYLVLNVAYSISWPMFAILKFFNYEVTNPILFHNLAKLNEIFSIIAYINHAVNFFFFLLKVKNFAKLLLFTFSSCCYCWRRQSSSRSSISAPNSSAAKPSAFTANSSV